jgi:hypothetical protein
VADLAETVAGLERDWWPISPKSAHCFMIVAMMAAIRFIWASLKQVFYHDQGCSFLDSSNTSIRYTKYNKYYL